MKPAGIASTYNEKILSEDCRLIMSVIREQNFQNEIFIYNIFIFKVLSYFLK